MEKIVKLSGRIDSANAPDIEQAINAEIGGFDGELTLDAAELEYISSAGLRVVLRLKKANSTTKIINCSSEVYEIFDMTGFTEMMSISKAYRELSVEGCEIIGEGANGVVYRTDPDTIVKVYKSPDSLAEIHNERELARKAFVMGIPTAIPYDVVRVGDLYGSVFELLNAKSFAKLINAGADVESLAKQSVEILKTMHATHLKPGELPSKKEEALVWARFCLDYLSEEEGKKLIALFEAVPETDTMLHGDYHIKNIMQQNGENLLIDMDTLSQGHPVFEFAAIYGAYEGFGCVDKDNPSQFLGIPDEACKAFWEYTLKYYFEGESDEFIQAVADKAKLIFFTRILRRTLKRFGTDDPEHKALADFCLNYVKDNVMKIDSLTF